MISLSLNNFPFFKSIAIIWPGPSFPFSIIFSSGILIMPLSEPAKNKLSEVIVYLKGRKPFLSEEAKTHLASVAQIAAGPSHGSIVLFKKLNKSWWFFGTVLLLFDQASGIIMSLISGASLPEWTNNSNTLSSAPESDVLLITGFKSFTFLNNELDMSCSWIFIQLIFPFKVLISPLWARVLNGWAKSQLGKVFVEYLWWKTANLEVSFLSFKSG